MEEKIWWNNVMNASRYIDDITDCLLNNQSIVLTGSDIIPWRSTMRDLVGGMVRAMNSQRTLRRIEDNQGNPGKYIMEKFCKEEKRARYRPSIGYAEFLAQSDDLVLNNVYVWVSVISPERLGLWTQFVIEYHRHVKKGQNPGVFILETSSFEQTNSKKHLKNISIVDYIGQYDVYIFNTLLSSSIHQSNYYKQYLSEVAANIAGADAEFSARCIDIGSEFLLNPYSTVCNIVNSSVNSNGSDFVFQMTESEVNKCVWKAQIKILFPLIEEYREKFIVDYNDKIISYLPIDTYYGETISEPNDIDIGPLWILVYNKRMGVSHHDYECIDVCRNARNQLAHIRTLSLEAVEEIFKFLIADTSDAYEKK